MKERIYIRISREDKEQIQRSAEKTYLSVSQYLRYLALNKTIQTKYDLDVEKNLILLHASQYKLNNLLEQYNNLSDYQRTKLFVEDSDMGEEIINLVKENQKKIYDFLKSR